MSTLPSDHLYRSERYRFIGGVCAGLALSRGFSISLTRLLALFLLGTGFGIVIYLVCWIVIPRASTVGIAEPDVLPSDPLQRSSKKRLVAGVCGGLAEFLRIDVSLVRILYLLTVLLAGVGLIPYIYAWIALPLRPVPESALQA